MTTGEIGQRIRTVRETYRGVGMKQSELARIIGVSSQRLSNWESGKHDPNPMAVLNRIADALGVSAKYLATGETDKGQIVSQPNSTQATERVAPQLLRLNAEPTGKIKVYGPISAGGGNTSSIDEDELDVPVQFSRQDFGALVVQGDSMLPFLHPSDIVIFKDWYAEKPNHIVAAFTPDGEWFVKLMVYDGRTYRLRSLNDRYPDIEPPFSISGYLVGFVRDDGPERTIRLNPYGLRHI